MCRMLGIIPKDGTPVDASIVRSFRNLASCGKVCKGSKPGHADGWGIVVWKERKPIYLGREPVDAFSDPRFDDACNAIEENEISVPVIAHLRKASLGAKTHENTHPFTFREWAFAHNGTIRKQNLHDRTDSEWFFLSLLEEIKRCNGDLEHALAKQAASVSEVYEYTSMTFLLSNGNSLCAYRDCSKDGDYYAIYYAKVNNSLVVAQEKFIDANWSELMNRNLLSVDSELKTKVTDISGLIETNRITA